MSVCIVLYHSNYSFRAKWWRAWVELWILSLVHTLKLSSLWSTQPRWIMIEICMYLVHVIGQVSHCAIYIYMRKFNWVWFTLLSKCAATVCHVSVQGKHKILDECTLPLTGKSVVDLIVTEMVKQVVSCLVTQGQHCKYCISVKDVIAIQKTQFRHTSIATIQSGLLIVGR